jgi:hypothetical protein
MTSQSHQQTGRYPQGEYHVDVVDQNGKPVPGTALNWAETPTRATGDEKGHIVTTQAWGGIQFGGQKWDLFWCIPMGDRSAGYVWEITAPGYRTKRVRSSEFSAGRRLTEETSVAILRPEEQPVVVPVYHYRFALDPQ